MKKISLFVLVLSLLVLTAACGSGSAPATQAPPTSPPEAPPTSPPEVPPTSPPEPTATPVEAPASMSGEAQEIQITVNASGYEPNSITVKPGSRTRFVFTNVDSETHDLFNRGMDFDAEFRPGTTTTYEWIAPQTPGTYTAECTYHEGLILIVNVK